MHVMLMLGGQVESGSCGMGVLVSGAVRVDDGPRPLSLSDRYCELVDLADRRIGL